MEPIDWVPWALTALAIPQTWYLRNKRRAGWVFNLAGCTASFAYNCITEQYGFLPLNLLFGITAISNYRKWRQDDTEPAPAADPAPATVRAAR